MKPKIIIDTDPGIDDAMAILMVLEAHKLGQVELIAILTCHGNCTLDHCNTNAFRILRVAQEMQVPVYPGATLPLVNPFKCMMEQPFHGYNGFGDVDLGSPDAEIDVLLQKEHASLALIRLIEQYKDEVVLLAIGPLTNIAISLNLDTNCLTNLRDFYIMGGNIAGEGNHSLGAEFNFLCDPEAAKVVLERSTKTVKVTPWETCRKYCGFTLEERNELLDIDTPAATLIRKIDQSVVARIKKKIEEGEVNRKWITCDQVAAAWMLDDLLRESDEFNGKKLATCATKYFGIVELTGTHTRGQLVLDNFFAQHKRDDHQSLNLQVLENIDKSIYTRYVKMGLGWKETSHPWE